MESLSSVAGALAGSLDRAYYLLRFAKNRPRFFSDGWGDIDEQKRIQADLIERLATPESCKEARKLASLRWDEHPTTRTRSGGGYTACRATFESPQSARLPDASRMARFYFVAPADAGIQKPWEASPSPSDGGKRAPSGIVLLLPSTGEQGSDGRMQLAERLACESGYRSPILTAPPTVRKPQQQLHYARTVALYLLQSTAIIEEAALLLCWCADRCRASACVSGHGAAR